MRKPHQCAETVLTNAANRGTIDHDEADFVKNRLWEAQEVSRQAEQILSAVQVFYDAHRDFIMDLEKRRIIKEGGLYRENLPLLLTVMAKAFMESKKPLDAPQE